MKFNAKPLFKTNTDIPEVLHNKAMIKLQECDRASYRFLLTTDTFWTDRVETAATDGFYIYINPRFYAEGCVNAKQRAFVLAHEVKHCWLRHPQRAKRFHDRGFYSHDLPFNHLIWNFAGDYVINADNVAMGMEAPKGVLLDKRFSRDDNVDVIFATLMREFQKEQEEREKQEGPEGQPGDESDDTDDTSDDTPEGDTGDNSSDETGDDEGSADPDGEETDEDGETGEGSGADESEDEGDEEGEGSTGDTSEDEGDEGEGSDDSDGEGEGEGEPQPTDRAGHDDHFMPQYEGNESEQEEQFREDEARITKNVDDAIDDFNEGEESTKRLGGGFCTAGYRHDDPANPSGIDWQTRLAHVMTRPGTGGPVNWGKINRRKLMVSGVVSPTRKGSIDRLAITRDISGSVSTSQWALFVTEFARVADMLKPANGTIVMATNTEMVQADVCMTGAEIIALRQPRGGGNDLRAGSEWLRRQGLNVDLHLVFTDGYTPTEDYRVWAREGAIVVLDRAPDSSVLRLMADTHVEYIVMTN